LDHTGNYQNLSAGTGVSNITTDGASQKIDSVFFAGGTNATDCTSSPCTIYQQSGTWLSSVSRTGVTIYNLNINTGVFSGAPSCPCNARSSTNIAACAQDFASSTATSVPITIGGASDGRVQVVCIGPK